MMTPTIDFSNFSEILTGQYYTQVGESRKIWYELECPQTAYRYQQAHSQHYVICFFVTYMVVRLKAYDLIELFSNEE